MVMVETVDPRFPVRGPWRPSSTGWASGWRSSWICRQSQEMSSSSMLGILMTGKNMNQATL